MTVRLTVAVGTIVMVVSAALVCRHIKHLKNLRLIQFSIIISRFEWHNSCEDYGYQTSYAQHHNIFNFNAM